MDGTVSSLKARENGKVINKPVYLCLCTNKKMAQKRYWHIGRQNWEPRFLDGYTYWLKNSWRVKYVDDQNSFRVQAKVSSLILFQYSNLCCTPIWSSCKCVVWKEKKAFSSDIKDIYNSLMKKVALHELDLFKHSKGLKYLSAIRSWKANWVELSSSFNGSLKSKNHLLDQLNEKSEWKDTSPHNKLPFTYVDALKKFV